MIEYEKLVWLFLTTRNFLNSFTHGVLYLDSRTRKIEYYVGNYFDVVAEITARIERDRMKKTSVWNEIFQSQRASQLFRPKRRSYRDVARKMNEKIEELEGQLVETRQDDKTIRDFIIPATIFSEPVATINSVSLMHNHKPTAKKVSIVLKKRVWLLIKSGPEWRRQNLLFGKYDKRLGKGRFFAQRSGYRLLSPGFFRP